MSFLNGLVSAVPTVIMTLHTINELRSSKYQDLIEENNRLRQQNNDQSVQILNLNAALQDMQNRTKDLTHERVQGLMDLEETVQQALNLKHRYYELVEQIRETELFDIDSEGGLVLL